MVQKNQIKEKIKEILENNYIEDSPDLILELFKEEQEKLLERIKLRKLENPYKEGSEEWCRIEGYYDAKADLETLKESIKKEV